MKKTKRTFKSVGLVNGFRSGLEASIGKALSEMGVPYLFESSVILYVKPVTKHRYTPDFFLENYIIIESKGRFLPADRKKHLLIKQQHPDLDIRFVFSNSKSRLNKTSTTTYAMWCEKNGFMYANKMIPEEWIKEPYDEVRHFALEEAMKK